MSVTDLEIEEAIREAWTILYAGAPPSACRLAATLLAVTGGTQAHPHWVTPDDLWRDRLAVLADQGRRMKSARQKRQHVLVIPGGPHTDPSCSVATYEVDGDLAQDSQVASCRSICFRFLDQHFSI
jgi:hypothetical protein